VLHIYRLPKNQENDSFITAFVYYSPQNELIMSLTTKDLVLIGTTFFFTSVVTTMTVVYLTSDTATVIGTDASERTTWDRTRILQNEYLEFNPLKVKYRNTAGIEVIDSLKGFVFSAEHLDEIIHHNFNFPSGSEKKPNEVLFLLGQEGSFTDIAGTNYGNMRLTAIGMKDKTLLTSSTTGGTSVSLFDKADPCPPNCPD
jgi:hypothetical protein